MLPEQQGVVFLHYCCSVGGDFYFFKAAALTDGAINSTHHAARR